MNCKKTFVKINSDEKTTYSKKKTSIGKPILNLCQAMSLIIICGDIFKKGFGLNKSHRLHEFNARFNIISDLSLLLHVLLYM